MRNYCIVIVKLLFLDRIEIIVVRLIIKFLIEDYELSERFLERFRDKVVGIFIVGVFGEGKMIFV